MTGITSRAAAAYSDYNVNGLPVSGLKDPRKTDIRALFAQIESTITATLPGAKLKGFKTSLSALNSDLNWTAGDMFIVSGDATAANNGLYIKNGASGAGSWANSGLTFAVALVDQMAQVIADYPDIIAAATSTAADRIAVAADRVAADADAASADSAANTAIAAAEAAGTIYKFYNTKALATADLANIPANGIIEVFADESQSGERTRYRKESGSLVYKVSLPGVTQTIASGDTRKSPSSDAVYKAIRIVQYATLDLFYNETTGNDANAGLSSGSPKKTFVALWTWVLQRLDLSGGGDIVIHATKNNPDPILMEGRPVGQIRQDQVKIVFNGKGTATLSGTSSANPLTLKGHAEAHVYGLTIQNTLKASHSVVVYIGSRLSFGDVHFGDVYSNTYFDIQVANSAWVGHTADYSISGNKGGHVVSEVGAEAWDLVSHQITFVSTPAFATAFVNVGEMAYADLGPGASFVGSFTGPPWLIAPSGELGQSSAGRAALQACTSTPGIKSSDFTLLTVGVDTGAQYPSNNRIIAVGTAGEPVVTSLSDVIITAVNSGDCAMSVNSYHTGKGAYRFGCDGVGRNGSGALQYDHSLERLNLITVAAVQAYLSAAGFVLNVPMVDKFYTYSTLPSPVEGMRTAISDCNTSTFYAAAAGGGSTKVPVQYLSSAWKVC